MHLKYRTVTKELLSGSIDDFIGISSGTPHDNWGKENYLATLDGKWNYSIAAFRDNTLEGYVLVSKKEGTRFHIHRFVVNSNTRGQGIGRTMLHYLENSILPKPCLLTLKVYDDNPAAVLFYRERGFMISDTVNGLHLMEKRLIDD